MRTTTIDAAREDFLKAYPDGGQKATFKRHTLILGYCLNILGLEPEEGIIYTKMVMGLYEGRKDAAIQAFDETRFLTWYETNYMQPFNKSLP